MEQTEYWIWVLSIIFACIITRRLVIKSMKNAANNEEAIRNAIGVIALCVFIGSIILSIIYHTLTGEWR